MKKYLSMTLLLTAMFLTFSSCSKDDEDGKWDRREEVEQETGYLFFYNGENPPQGIDFNITLFEYNEKGEKIAQNHVTNCQNGTKRSFIANQKSQKVKVYVVMKRGSASDANWVQQVFYLEKGKIVEVAITGQSKIGKNEP